MVLVDLEAFSRAGALMLEAGEESLIDAVIDPAGEYAYFAAFTQPGRVVKIGLGASSVMRIYLPLVARSTP